MCVTVPERCRLFICLRISMTHLLIPDFCWPHLHPWGQNGFNEIELILLRRSLRQFSKVNISDPSEKSDLFYTCICTKFCLHTDFNSLFFFIMTNSFVDFCIKCFHRLPAQAAVQMYPLAVLYTFRCHPALVTM